MPRVGTGNRNSREHRLASGYAKHHLAKIGRDGHVALTAQCAGARPESAQDAPPFAVAWPKPSSPKRHRRRFPERSSNSYAEFGHHDDAGVRELAGRSLSQTQACSRRRHLVDERHRGHLLVTYEGPIPGIDDRSRGVG